MPAMPPGAGEEDRRSRIRIVEADHAAAAVLQTLLRTVGYEVTVATGGEQAFRLLDEGPPPDLLLLDWMLPEISGLEICSRVRERWDPLDLPILMVTAKTDVESISAAFDAGASDYLTKPFLGAELRARIAAHLRVRQMAEERRRFDEYLMERDKLSTLGLLVSGVAHDLNNPLAGITGYTQLLLEDETDPEKLDSLRRVLAEVQRCNRIVGDLLGFARRNPPERQPVRLEDVLHSTLELRGRALAGAGIRTRLEMAPELPEVLADEHQLQQVFLNVVLNAEQALRQCGSRIDITAAVAPPSTRLDPSSLWVAVELANDGPHIPPEALPRIFEPFFTTKGKEEGTGLGLPICQRIVREHGGEMEVESSPGRTVFRILLPASPELNLPL